MNNKAKMNIQKKMDAKKEIERLSNKSLTIFTVALFCEVILMFLYSGLTSSGAYRNATDGLVCGLFVFTVIVFFALFITSLILKKNKKMDAISGHMFNWSLCVLAISFGAFLIVAETVVATVFDWIGLTYLGGALAVKMVRFTGETAALFLMYAVAVYTVIMFIYYNLKAKKIKK